MSMARFGVYSVLYFLPAKLISDRGQRLSVAMVMTQLRHGGLILSV